MEFQKKTVLLVLCVLFTISLELYAQTKKEIKLEKRRVRQKKKDSL